MNSITLGGKPVYDPPAGFPPILNQFTMFTGAARPGYGEFLMTRADYTAMLNEGNADQIYDLVMKATGGNTASAGSGGGGSGDGCGSPNNLTIKVIIAGARAISTSAQGDDKNMVGVIVYDLRLRYIGPISAAYNVQKQGPEYSGSTPQFYASTLNSSAEWAWADVLTDLELNPSHWPSLPSWKPRNLAWQAAPIGWVVDEIAAEMFYVVGYKWCAQTTGAGPAIRAYAANSLDPANASLLTQAATSRIDGDLALRPAERFASHYAVTFPRMITDDDTADVFADPTYTKTISVNPSGKNGTELLMMGRYIAAVASAALINQAELDAVAADLAPRAFAAASAPIGEREYAGLWPFTPDGYIRGIRWINDRHGARTFIRINNARDFSPLAELARGNEQAANQFVMGLGTVKVSTTPGGVRVVAARGGGTTTDSSVGTLTGQVRQMVTDNTAAWQLPVAHSVE